MQRTKRLPKLFVENIAENLRTDEKFLKYELVRAKWYEQKLKRLLENLTHTNEKLKGMFEILPCFVQITLLESTKNFVPQIHAIEVHSNANK